MELDSETSKKILDADIANIVKKVKAGKTLSAAERALIEKSETPKKEKNPKHKIYEGMEYFAKMRGVSLGFVKAAKKAGCPAFLPGNRIDSKIFFRWLSDNPTFGKVSDTAPLKEQKTFEEVRKLRIANDAKEKMSVLRSAVCSSIAQTEKAIDELLENKLEKEYPAMVSGLDIPGARVYGRNLRDSIRAEIQKMERFWKI